MNRSYVSDVKPGEVKIQGFVENIRNKKSMAFLVIRDLTGKIQVTVEKAALPEIAAEVDKLTLDSVVTVEGTAVASEFVKLGGIEILPTSLTIESIADALPIQDGAAIDSRLDYRWIDLRSEKNALMMKVQTLMVASMRNFLLEKDFVEIHTPKIIGAASESGSEVFRLDYFDRDAYLAQSPQFYK
ncbi:MAG: OB-fold nucleic acid binding domain-containing protein, partial [Clostridia bacterium]|nr:OB-fold nucleic acid binding domain-containing protein [Clostridia bacterium]